MKLVSSIGVVVASFFVACSTGVSGGSSFSSSSSGGSSSSSASSTGGTGSRSAVALSDLVTGCATDNDCTTVPSSVGCCAVCMGAAISKSKQATYNDRAAAERAALQCATNVACPKIACAAFENSVCRSNTCLLATQVGDGGGGMAGH